jgi:hypothetical protein
MEPAKWYSNIGNYAAIPLGALFHMPEKLSSSGKFAEHPG